MRLAYALPPPTMAGELPYAVAAASPREASEDRAEVLEHAGAVVVAVADGAGGMRGGGEASSSFITAVRARLGSEHADPCDLEAWLDLFERTDTVLARAMTGETTAVVVVLGAHGILGVSVGDSEVWVVGATGIDRLTGEQDRRRLGSGRSSAVAFQRPTLAGTLVAATDGLFKLAAPESIAASCRGGAVAQIAASLLALPRSRSGSYADDLALVVVTPTPHLSLSERRPPRCEPRY